jgi:hypothetical protein
MYEQTNNLKIARIPQSSIMIWQVYLSGYMIKRR